MTAGLQGQRRMLTGRSAPKIETGYHDLIFLDPLMVVRIEILHAVLGHVFVTAVVQIASGDDDIRIDIVLILDNVGFNNHGLLLPLRHKVQTKRSYLR